MTWNIAAFGPSAVNSFTPILPTNIVSIKDISGSANNAPSAGTANVNISFVSSPSSIIFMEKFVNADDDDDDEVEDEVVEALSPDCRRLRRLRLCFSLSSSSSSSSSTDEKSSGRNPPREDRS